MFADLGETELRGFEDPVRLYELGGGKTTDLAQSLHRLDTLMDDAYSLVSEQLVQRGGQAWLCHVAPLEF